MVPIPKLLKSLAMASLWAVPAAQAQVLQVNYTVNTDLDGHDAVPGDGFCQATGVGCTLRAAIEENNVAPGWGIIALPAGDYVLELGTLTVSSDLAIRGAGVGYSRIDADRHLAFSLDGGATGTNIWFNDLAISNGYNSNSIGSGRGGGIYVGSDHTNVSLVRVHMIDNESDWQGGAIYNAQGWVGLEECLIFSNSVPRSDGSGVEGSGGGIWNGGTMEIRRSTISGNEGTQGGGILNVNSLKVINSTVSNNLVTWRGGGLQNAALAGSAVIAFSTFTGNQVGVAPGPGRFPPQQGPFGGGAIYNVGRVSVGNSIIADNEDLKGKFTADYSPDCWSIDHPSVEILPDGTQVPITAHPIWSSYRNNILGVYDPAVCNAKDDFFPAPPLDQYGSEDVPLDPLLGSMQSNGGPYYTHAVLPGSPALDRSNGYPGLSDFTCPATDQRGVPRPPANAGAGTLCDVGAYEHSTATGPMEAEDAQLSGAFVKSSHAEASGGWYTSTSNVLPGDPNGDQMNGPSEDHKLSFNFYIDEPGLYNLKAWAHALPPDDNSFYVRVDGGESFIWDLAASGTGFAEYYVSDRGAGDELNPETARIGFSLSKGMHTLEIYQRETGTWLDKVEFVRATAAQMNFETESLAMLHGAFMISNDPAASGARYIAAPPAFNGAVTAPDPAHKAVFTLQAPQAGTYLLRANVHAVMDDHNSFWVKVDGGTPYLWDMSETNTRYGLDYLSHRGNGDSRDPEIGAVELTLAAGSHTVEVFAREGDTRLDRIGLELKSDAEAKIVSRNKPMHSSSNQNSSFGPEKAVDGNASTRWSSLASDNQWIKVDLGGTYDVHRVVLNWEAAYGRDYALQISNDAENWTNLYLKEAGNGGVDDWTVQGRGRYVRMLGLARGTQYGYSLYEFNVYGVAAVSGTINIAQGKTPTVSSAQTAEFAGAKAVDGNAATRWSSNFNDYEWIWVDLGTAREITRVKLTWEAAYGRGYEILVSDDASAWTPLFTTSAGNGGTDDLSVSGRGRYVKMRGVQRGTSWGYSLYEFAVFGK